MVHDKTADEYFAPIMKEVEITAKAPEGWRNRIDKQNKYIVDNKFESERITDVFNPDYNKPKYPYAIVDKKHNLISYYQPTGEKIKEEQVITGANNKDADYGMSMKDWFKANNTDSHSDYFKYLAESENKVTPAGHFTVSGLREHVMDNPDKVGDFWNSLFNTERRNKIIADRTRDYGKEGKIFTLKDEAGGSSKAIHHTANPIREAVLNSDSDFDERDLSNGCINVKDKSICFETLKKGSSVYVLPEETPELITEKNKMVNNGNVIKKAKSQTAAALFSAKLPYDKRMLDILTTISGKETQFGTSKIAAIEDYLPEFASDGPYQINPKSFKDYLPSDYKPTYDKQTIAVYNFIKHMDEVAGRPLTIDEIYDNYNTGENTKTKLTSKMKRTLAAIYERVQAVD